MNEYARATGREGRLLNPAQESKKTAVLRPLTDLEQVRIAENRRAVYEYMPELVPEIKELVKLGLINGWRNVQKVEIFKKDTA